MNILLARTFDLFDKTKPADGIFGVIPGSQKDAALGGSANLFVETISYVVIAAGVVAGLILLGMLIMGAITYMTSAGDEKVLTRAKQQMTNAVIGFVIIAMSYWIVRIIGTIFGLPNILKPTFIGP
ncbi:hypothetical protein L6255_04010 [Candidatus Parcubacteria bacterium]|nr:hypothetical protein [Patescibacteria group bacterium]MBU4380658.1 hypothetical protein [Patescibacteria group bacterium]MCG2689575.1 hypothetical protein [Candidatus Parcubacteria bacterium]